MVQRLCSRCRTVVRFEDDNSLVYCGNCGLPQVRLSLELQEQATAQIEARREAQSGLQTGLQSGSQSPATGRPLADRPDPTAIDWPRLMRYAAGVSAVFVVLVFLLPPMGLFSAPIAIGLYAARHRQAAITTRIGVRIGLLTGLLTGVGIAFVQTLVFLALRYGAHTTDLDTSIDAVFAHTREQMVAVYGRALADTAAPLFAVPEYRVGIFLLGLLLYGIALLVLGMVGGAFAGYWRSRPRLRT